MDKPVDTPQTEISRTAVRKSVGLHFEVKLDTELGPSSASNSVPNAKFNFKIC